MTVYVSEEWSPHEADVLRRYFTNLDGPVFALVNLPEVVKGALFARYSRSPKSLRRLFLDEFVGDLDIAGDQTVDATVGLRRAEELYDRVFFEYGDDSVAQLGGVHLACEQASNLLTKVLEWGRLAAYLEQSTRYIAYDSRIGGRYRFFRPPEVLGSPFGTRFVGDMDRLFDTYAELVPVLVDFFREAFPKDPADSDFVYRQAIKAKAFDALRGILPAASLSNLGIYATGQAYESLLLRMRSHPLPEARQYAGLMLTELRKVIPSFLKRVDLDDRGVAWSTYLASTRTAMEDVSARLFPAEVEPDGAPDVRLLEWDPDGEIRMVAAMLYPYTPPPRGPDRAPGAGHDRRRASRGGAGLRRRPQQPAAQAGPGPRAAPVPLRRARRLRRLPRPATPPHAHHRVAGAVAPARLHPPGGGRRRQRHRPLRRGHGPFGGAARRAARALPGGRRLRRVPRLQGAVRHGPQRPGGDAHARAAHLTPGPPRVPHGGPAHAHA